MKKKFKKALTFKLNNKQLHKNYSYKSLILFYFLFTFDFFLLKNKHLFTITKIKYNLYKYYNNWKKKKINSLIIWKNKLNVQHLFLFFSFILYPFQLWEDGPKNYFEYDSYDKLTQKLMFNWKLKQKINIIQTYFYLYVRTLGDFKKARQIYLNSGIKGICSHFGFNLNFIKFNFTKDFIDKYYKNLYITTNYFNIYINLI
jgi:hypothetical protein